MGLWNFSLLTMGSSDLRKSGESDPYEHPGQSGSCVLPTHPLTLVPLTCLRAHTTHHIVLLANLARLPDAPELGQAVSRLSRLTSVSQPCTCQLSCTVSWLSSFHFISTTPRGLDAPQFIHHLLKDVLVAPKVRPF